MKPLKLLLALAMVVIAAVLVIETGGQTYKGESAAPRSRKENIRLQEDAAGPRELDEASQILFARSAGDNNASTRKGLAEGIATGAISRHEMENLIKSIGADPQSEHIIDVLYSAAANRLISTKEDVEISRVDGRPILDAGGKPVTVDSLDAWFDYGNSVAEGKCEGGEAGARMNAFSERIQAHIRHRTARDWLGAVKMTCADFEVEWSDFIRLCLMGNNKGSCFCGVSGN